MVSRCKPSGLARPPCRPRRADKEGGQSRTIDCTRAGDRLPARIAERRKLGVLWQYGELSGHSKGGQPGGRAPYAVLDSEPIKAQAREIGFDLVGVAPAEPTLESAFYPVWLAKGYHGAMAYLEGRRGDLRADPRSLLPAAQSVICVGLVYNTPGPYSTEVEADGRGWVSRYAWGQDYHDVIRTRLRRLADWIRAEYGDDTQCKICVDTSPLLERAYARRAGLGWIGKNTCLIDEHRGSWFFLAEILTSLRLAPDDAAAYRCGSCRRCIDACPTDALVETGEEPGPSHALDARRCISYWTIELRGPIPEEHRPEVGQHLFGCDICQDVCPWNSHRRVAVSDDPAFSPVNGQPDLEELASLTEEQFNARFAGSPIERSRYAGFLRNVAVAMGNSGDPALRPAAEHLARSPEPTVREHALWALERLASGDRTGGRNGCGSTVENGGSDAAPGLESGGRAQAKRSEEHDPA